MVACVLMFRLKKILDPDKEILLQTTIMDTHCKTYQRKMKLRVLLLIPIISFANMAMSQTSGIYPPFTKWYQDPLGLKPIQLSTAVGFAWASVAAATCLMFNDKDSSSPKKLSVCFETGYGFAYKSPYTNVLLNEMGIMRDMRKCMSIGISLNSFHFRENQRRRGNG